MNHLKRWGGGLWYGAEVFGPRLTPVSGHEVGAHLWGTRARGFNQKQRLVKASTGCACTRRSVRISVAHGRARQCEGMWK
jgi:hypothetical protein